MVRWFQPGSFPDGDDPKIRAGDRDFTLAHCRSHVALLARAIRKRFVDCSSVGLFIEPGPELCFALVAIAAARKTCIPFDFVRHRDNLGDCIDEGLPLISTRGHPPFAGASAVTVQELLSDPAGAMKISLREPAPELARPLFATRLGLVRLEFSRRYLAGYFQRLDQWMTGRPSLLLTGVSAMDFIGLLELFWFLHRPGRILFPAGLGLSIAELRALLWKENVDYLQCDAGQAAALSEAGLQIDSIIMGRNEDVDSDRFRQLMR